MEYDDDVRPVTFVRVMGAFTDLGLKYRVEEDDENVLIASWPGYITRTVWDGPFEPTLVVSARLWADMGVEKLPDLQRWVGEWNASTFQPTVTYAPGEEGRLLVNVRGCLSLKGGLSDAQLRDNLDRLLGSINQTARALGTEFPELTHTDASYLQSIGAPALDLRLPVTADRIAEVLPALGVEDIGIDGERAAFDFGDCTYLCSVEGDDTWLQVRSPMEESWGIEHYEQLVDLANDFNREDWRAVVLVERIGKWYRLVIQTSTAISHGMTTAQLGEALRDAVWGHDILWGKCYEKLRSIEVTPATD